MFFFLKKLSTRAQIAARNMVANADEEDQGDSSPSTSSGSESAGNPRSSLSELVQELDRLQFLKVGKCAQISYNNEYNAF